MLLRLRRVGFSLALLIVLWLPSRLASPGYTRLDLVDLSTGRHLFTSVLPDGEPVQLTWTNSIFRQNFKEVFAARDGELVLIEVTVTDPNDPYQMPVRPVDVDDLYHVGGAFTAKGLEKPFHDVIYRIGEIGDPHLRVQGQVIGFKQEVGFGGRIHLTTRQPTFYERLLPEPLLRKLAR